MISEREQLERQLAALKTERHPFELNWRAILRQFQPYAVDLSLSEYSSEGQRKDRFVLNNHPIRARRTLCAGLMASATSPVQRWHQLTTADTELAERQSVRSYFFRVQEIIDATLHRSNLYNVLAAGVYPFHSTIGISCMLEEERPGFPPHFEAVAPGKFWISRNKDGVTDTLFREFEMRAIDLVGRFGEKQCSTKVRDAVRRGNNFHKFPVRYAVLPNNEYNANKPAVGDNMPFRSFWWERGSGDSFLKRGGYHEFPAMTARWIEAGNTAYAYGPGWDALGDCKMLQHHEHALLRLIDNIKDPAMIGTDNLADGGLVPGTTTFMPRGEEAFLKPVYEPNPQAIKFLVEHIQRVEYRISDTLYANLWRLLIEDTRSNKTATEVEFAKQEAMLLLGPSLSGLGGELMRPLILRTYYILNRNDMLPIPPPEIQGADLKVEFISPLHAMQRASGLSPVRLFMSEIARISQLRPDVIDMINARNIVGDLQRMTGVSPDSILSVEELQKLQAERKQEQEIAQTPEAFSQVARGVRSLGQTNPENLQQMTQMLSQAAAAQGGGSAPPTPTA